MKFLLLALLATNAHALKFELVKPCSSEIAINKIYESKPQSAGAATVEILNKEQIPYIGSELGMNSILGSPVDKEAMEFRGSDILAFGWCYEVDGKQPEQMPSEVQLKGTESLRWFYGFARLSGSKWVSYCEPSYLAKPGKVCP